MTVLSIEAETRWIAKVVHLYDEPQERNGLPATSPRLKNVALEEVTQG